MKCLNRILVLCDGILGLILLTLLDYGEGLTCVRCDSERDETPGECQHNPPAPVPCPGHYSSNKYCIVVRELDKQGQLVHFVRDCSTVNDNNCTYSGLQPPHPFQICYNSCQENGCNSARPSRCSMPWVLGLTVMATVLLSCRYARILECALVTF